MTLQNWLQENKFSLGLSSGFFGFYAHCGFVKALYEAQCIPQAVAGSSAGAIVAGALASGLEPAKIEEIILKLGKKDFWDPALGFGLVRGELFEKILSDHFIDDFSQAKLPLHISVFDIYKFRTTVARTGSAAKAIRASCAVPLMFHPTMIDKRPFWDGGIFDKAGILGLGTESPVLCHYLKSPGFLANLEHKNLIKKSSPNLKILLSEGLPSSGPNLMHLGKSIIDLAYEQTKSRLQEAP
jgi:NTE family protein